MLPKNKHEQNGFTLVELLVAAAILLVILGLVTTGIGGGSNAVSAVVTSSELNEDTRVAGQMIADGVARAVYVYPPGAELSLNGASSYSVKNPRTNKNVWKVGTDPILAYLENPEDTGVECLRTVTLTDGSTVQVGDETGCLYFVAYYPIKRSLLVKRAAYDHLADSRNEDAWILLEYRKRLSAGLSELQDGTLRDPPLTRDNGLSDTSGRLLVDYLVPGTGFNVLGGTCRQRDDNGRDVTLSADACDELVGEYEADFANTLVSGQFALQAKSHRRAGSTTTPAMRFGIAPRNLVSAEGLE